MSEYHPDKWCILKISQGNKVLSYRVFGSWYGGFAGSNSWKMNSGITQAIPRFDDNTIIFQGASGSSYACHDQAYGLSMYSRGVLEGIKEHMETKGVTLELMPENTDWFSLDYAFGEYND